MIPNACKDPLLGMYYLATLPARRQAAAHRAASGESPITVLFYHRVADHHPGDWTISTERFKAQIDWVRHRFEIISLVEAQQRIGAGTSSGPAVCITFDDGYSENCREAIPWLIEQDVPVTYFVATRHLLSGEPFDHDVKNGQPLAPNNVLEIRAMAEAGVEIGAHTRTHADLGQANEEQLHEEIVGSKRELESIIGSAVRYFAFPLGLPANLSETAFRTAFRAGYWGVCSAYGGYNQPGDDAFHFQRVHGDPSWARFCNSLTIDPRKIEHADRFDPGDYRLCF